MGYTGSNGTDTYWTSASIDEMQQARTSNAGVFRYDQTSGSAYSDFAQGFDPINPYNAGGRASTYTVPR